jgi:tetratricopeptide (TPR) repeat protein
MQATIDQQFEAINQQIWEMWRLFEQGHGEYGEQGLDGYATLFAEKSLQISQRLYQGDHPHVATSMRTLSRFYLEMKTYEQALPLAEQALEMCQRVYSGDHPDVAASMLHLACLKQQMRAYDQALPLARQALEMYQRVCPGDHPDVITSLLTLASLYKEIGTCKQLRDLKEQTRCTPERVPPEPDVATLLNSLIRLNHAMEAYEQALPPAERALGTYQRWHGWQSRIECPVDPWLR